MMHNVNVFYCYSVIYIVLNRGSFSATPFERGGGSGSPRVSTEELVIENILLVNRV